jgi:hypothetical protein
MELAQEVTAAVLVDDLADDILAWITALHPLHTAIDRRLDTRCQQYLAVLGFGRCCGRYPIVAVGGLFVAVPISGARAPASIWTSVDLPALCTQRRPITSAGAITRSRSLTADGRLTPPRDPGGDRGAHKITQPVWSASLRSARSFD